jgi:hypothetical protein
MESQFEKGLGEVNTADESSNQKGESGQGPKVVHIQVQTPRGLWSMTKPENAKLRPEYRKNTKVAVVIDDARAVFNFVEQDSKYTLFFNGAELAPERTLESYQVEEGSLFVLSVQGGNA